MKIFYTYIYFIDNIPEYVGKGTGDRVTAHLTDINKTHWSNHIRNSVSLGRKITISLIPAKDERAALDKEIELIKHYGRRTLATGSLYNLTDGGDGVSGLSEESRRKISEAHAGKKLSPAHIAAVSKGLRTSYALAPMKKRKGVPMTDEHKKRVSDGSKGKIFSDEHKLSLSLAAKQRWAKKKLSV